jgi:hypothetical protein
MSQKKKVFKKWKKKINKNLPSIFLKKILFYYLLSKPLWKITVIKTKNNVFWNVTKYNGDLCCWFTGKQQGFKKKQLKSPYTLDVFYEFFFFLLQKYNIQFLSWHVLGKKKLIKDLLFKSLNFYYFSIFFIKKFPRSFNGCKARHKRRL